MGLLLIWILYGLAQGWGCPYPVMLGWGTPAESGQVGEALSACWVQCCVCVFTGGQQHSSVQLNSLHAQVTLASAMACGLTQADVSLESGVPSLSQDSSGPGAQGKPAGADGWQLAAAIQALWLQPIPDAQCAQRRQPCSALQGPFALGAFRCVALSCRSAFTSPPLLPGKGEAEGECFTRLVLCHHGSSLLLWLPARMVLYWEWAGLLACLEKAYGLPYSC